MADRRMFSKKLTDSDTFISMPATAQLLYFHLNQGADDDGFNNQLMIAMMKAKAKRQDFEMLLSKNLLMKFDSGVVVITHWKCHNTLRKDRYSPTAYKKEFEQLTVLKNGMYALGCQTVAEWLPQDRLGKDRSDKVSIGKDNIDMTASGDESPSPSVKKKAEKHRYGIYKNVLLTDDERKTLEDEFPNDIQSRIDALSEYMESHGKKYKSHLATIRAWARKEEKEHSTAVKNSQNSYDAFMEQLKILRMEEE